MSPNMDCVMNVDMWNTEERRKMVSVPIEKVSIILRIVSWILLLMSSLPGCRCIGLSPMFDAIQQATGLSVYRVQRPNVHAHRHGG